MDKHCLEHKTAFAVRIPFEGFSRSRSTYLLYSQPLRSVVYPLMEICRRLGTCLSLL